MSIFKLPDLGEGLQDAEIREWHVAVGDKVEIDDPLVSVETAKAIVEVPSPIAGYIRQLHGKAGDVVATGAALVEFDATKQTQSQSQSVKPPAEPSARQDAATVVGEVKSSNQILHESATGVTPRKVTTPVKLAKASPAVRLLAHQLGVVLATVQGTGPEGTITRQDIERAQQSALTTSSTAGQMEPLSAVDRYMAALMEKSHREVVAVTVIDDADVSHWPAHEDISVRLIRAIIAACQSEPNLNAHFDGEQLTRTRFQDVQLGLALDTEHGLFVPVIRQAQTLTDAALREQINAYKQQALARTLTPKEMQGATIVLSNFGIYGGKYANPIIVPPTVAIIGAGHLYDQNISEEGKIVSKRFLPLSLSFDHRAVTGGQASRFLAALIQHLS